MFPISAMKFDTFKPYLNGDLEEISLIFPWSKFHVSRLRSTHRGWKHYVGKYIFLNTGL